MARLNIVTPKIQPMTERHGLAMLSVAIALECALFPAHRQFEKVEFGAFRAIIHAASPGSVRK